MSVKEYKSLLEPRKSCLDQSKKKEGKTERHQKNREGEKKRTKEINRQRERRQKDRKILTKETISSRKSTSWQNSTSSGGSKLPACRAAHVELFTVLL